MKLIANPSKGLSGACRPAGDKSLSHRAALFAALAQGESCIDNFLVAGVTRAMLDGLSALQVEWRLDGQQLRVNSPGYGGWKTPDRPLNCGNSATTIRLLTGGLAAAGIPAVLDGTDSLRRRPMKRILEPLEAMGAHIGSAGGCAPLKLPTRTGPLRGINHRMAVASAQVKSCLLLAGLAAQGETVLVEPGPSRDHTERMLRSMGFDVTNTVCEGGAGLEYITRLNPPARLVLPPVQAALVGDISAAAFLIVAALITPGSDIEIHNVGLNPTRTGLLDALQAMGAQIDIQPLGDQYGEPAGNLRVRSSQLSGVEISGSLVVRMIDEFPAFAVAAAFADGLTNIKDADELRHKESDRILALCKELRNLGIDAREHETGFSIQGGVRPSGGRAASHNDHRLAMALALVGLAAHSPVEVDGAEFIGESFPNFVEMFQALGANLEEIQQP